MLRFCLAGEYPLDTTKIGGGVWHVMYILGETFSQRDDIEFHVVTTAKGLNGVKIEKKPGMTIHYVGVPTTRLIPNLLTQSKKIASVIRDINPDVINSHLCVTTEAAVLAGCKVAHTIHGVIHNEIKYTKGKNRLSTTLHSMLERRAISRADAVLGVAQYAVDAYKSSIKSEAYTMNVPIEDIFFDAVPMKPSKSVLYVGVIGERKNLIALVKAMAIVRKKHTDAILHVCGPVVQPQYMSGIKSFIQEHELHDAINFVGLATRTQIVQYIGESVCLALPSRQESAPGVICQAMAGGRPVIASPVGGVPEMVDEGVTGFLVDSEDHELLAARIVELFDNFNKAKQMGDRAREVAASRYNRHTVAEHILEVCRTLIN